MARYLIAFINSRCELHSHFVDSTQLELGEEATAVEVITAERLDHHRLAYDNHPWFPVCEYHDTKRESLEDETVMSVYHEAESGDLQYLGAVREELLNPYVGEEDDEEEISDKDWEKQHQRRMAHSERWDALYTKLLAYVRGRPSRIERGTDEERYALIAREVAAKNWELLQPENRVDFVSEVEKAVRKANELWADLPLRNGVIRSRPRPRG
jgi:hypothetical protein